MLDIDTNSEKQLKTDPIGFIHSTKDQHPMPGTKAPAAARLERYEQDEKMVDSIVEDEDGSLLAPCFAHGDYVKVEALQADYLQAKDEIKRRQLNLIELLNKEADFSNFVLNLPGAGKFFVKTKMSGDNDYKIYGTLLYYEIYFNDIDNLWLICQACNLQKGNKDTIQWLSQQWAFGKQFLDYIARETKRETDENTSLEHSILRKLDNNRGLAQVAIEWFWTRHGTYVTNAKMLLENISVTLKIMNKTLDHIIGLAHENGLQPGELRKIEVYQASLKVRMDLGQAVVDAPGLDMPAPDGSTVSGRAPLLPKDEQGKSIEYDVQDYNLVMQEVVNTIPEIINEESTERLKRRKLSSNTISSDFSGPSGQADEITRSSTKSLK